MQNGGNIICWRRFDKNKGSNIIGMSQMKRFGNSSKVPVGQIEFIKDRVTDVIYHRIIGILAVTPSSLKNPILTDSGKVCRDTDCLKAVIRAVFQEAPALGTAVC